MKHLLRFLSFTLRTLLALLILSLSACHSNSEQEGIRIDYVDSQVEAGSDFYRHACGAWATLNPIPDNYARFSIYDQLLNEEDSRLRKLIGDCSIDSKDMDEQRVATLYRLVRSDDRRRQHGLKPVKNHLEYLDTLFDREALIRECHYQHSIDLNPLFELYRNDSLWILQACRLPLSATDYSAAAEPARVSRQMYANNLITLLIAYGYSETQAHEIQAKAFDFETQISQISHMSAKSMPLIEVEQLLSPFDLRSLMGPHVHDSTYVLCSESYLRSIRALLDGVSEANLNAYVRSIFVRGSAPYLSPEMAQLATRTPLLAPNDHFALRDIDVIKHWLPHELSRLYRKNYIAKRTPERLEELWERVKSAFIEKLETQSWLTDAEKKSAIDRVTSIQLWAFSMDPAPVDAMPISDRSYWDAIEQLRKTYVMDGHKNENWLPAYATQVYFAYGEGILMLPAGILQAPFFYPEGDKASNLGSMGVLMAGALADAAFQISTKATDITTFALSPLGQRLQHLQVVFDPLKTLSTLKDLIALEILDELREQWVDPYQGRIDKLSSVQRFFMSYAQMNAEQMRRGDLLRTMIVPTLQAPAHLRVNAVVVNLHSWYQAFDVSPMHTLYHKPEARTVFFEN